MLFLYLISLSLVLFLADQGSVCVILGFSHAFSLQLDSSSYIFMITLLQISFSVLVWSYYYIDSTVTYRTFVSLVLFFLFSICGLVVSADLLSLFVFWDLLGFSSLFLVFYYRTRGRISAGLLTGLTNRIGDCLLLGYFCACIYSSDAILCVGAFTLMSIAITKSAQVPFSAWLPAAMLAPTPVRALVHSSTLVTAGVYLLYRFSSHLIPELLYIGIFTTVVSGLAALVQPDFKKIIALSTLSQLGLIISTLGLNLRTLCFAHLNLHASFKALLFIAVGVMIHTVYGSQGFRIMGTKLSSSSLIGTAFTVACLSMCGLFCLSGWCRKESILCSSYNSYFSFFTVFGFYCGMVLTVAYCVRLLCHASNVSSCHIAMTSVCSVTLFVKIPIILLCFLAITQGIWLLPTVTLVHTILTSGSTLYYFSSIGLGVWLGFIISPRISKCPSPFNSLTHFTTGLSSVNMLLSGLFVLEAPQSTLTYPLYRLPYYHVFFGYFGFLRRGLLLLTCI